MWDLVRTLKGDVEVVRGGKIGPKRHCAYAYWLKSEAEINVLIGNRENKLK